MLSLSNSMRSIWIERTGPPETLVGHSLHVPEPAEDEVRIRVTAAGVNFADLLQRLGLYGHAPRRPYVPGFEVAGVVDCVGAQVSHVGSGQRVAALIPFGGYAEFAVAPEISVFPLPHKIDLASAAALPVNYLTAWFCLYRLADVRRGESVLITGGAGGVGTAAVQLARSSGCRVFATVGTDEKVRFVKRLGADFVFNYHREDVFTAVKQTADAMGIDVLLDAVGGWNLRRLSRLVAPLGRIVSYGLASAAPSTRRLWWTAAWKYFQTPRFHPLQLMERNLGVFGFHLGLLDGRQAEIRSAFEQILALVAAGRIRPVIDRIFPLTAQGAAAAHRYLHERKNLGKVLLSPLVNEPTDGSSWRESGGEE